MTLDANLAIAASRPLLQKAVAVLRPAWEQNPRDWKTGWKLAEKLRQLGSLQEACKVYTDILSAHPGCREADYTLRVLAGCDATNRPRLGFTPVPFVYREDFLPAVLLERLWQCVSDNANQFRQSRVVAGLVENARNSRVLNSSRLSAIRSDVSAVVLRELGNSMSRLGLEPFDVSGGELELVSHGDGQYYHAHADTGSSGYSRGRAVSFVIYFFREPKRFAGGDLVLYDSSKEAKCSLSRYTRIIPRNNSLIMFPSTAYHQVTRVSTPDPRPESGRFSITGWLHHSLKDRLRQSAV